jgi:rhamnose transport system substrate-binding protein
VPSADRDREATLRDAALRDAAICLRIRNPVFGLWSVPDLGYLSYQVAAKLVSGEITGKEGETFTVKGLNDDKPYTIGKDSVVILGPAFRFDSTNVDNFNF